jgi:hypothetical protein
LLSLVCFFVTFLILASSAFCCFLAAIKLFLISILACSNLSCASFIASCVSLEINFCLNFNPFSKLRSALILLFHKRANSESLLISSAVGLLNKFNFSSSNSFSLSVADNVLYSLIVFIKGVFICLSSS